MFPLVEDGVLVETKTTESCRFHLGPQTDVFQDNKGGNLSGIFFFAETALSCYRVVSKLYLQHSSCHLIPVGEIDRGTRNKTLSLL